MNKRKLVLLLGLGFTIASLYFAFRGTNFSDIARNLEAADWRTAPLFILALIVFYGLKAVRWQQLLQIDNSRPEIRQLIRPMMIGFAANNLLPFRLGELIRIVLGARALALPKGTVLASVGIERVFDLVAILVLSAATFSFIDNRAMDHPVAERIVPFAILATFGLIGLIVAAPLAFSVLRWLLRFLPSRLRQFATEKTHTIETGFRAIGGPLQLLLVLTNSLAQWLILAISIYLSCAAVGVEISLSGSIYLMLLLTIAVSVPSTPGFVGIVEYSFVLGLGAFGVAAEPALAAAIFYHALSWLFVVLVGTICLRAQSRTWSEISAIHKSADT